MRRAAGEARPVDQRAAFVAPYLRVLKPAEDAWIPPTMLVFMIDRIATW